MLVVYLYMVNYGRSRPEEVAGAISGFLSVRSPAKWLLVQGIDYRTARIEIL